MTPTLVRVGPDEVRVGHAREHELLRGDAVQQATDVLLSGDDLGTAVDVDLGTSIAAEPDAVSHANLHVAGHVDCYWMVDAARGRAPTTGCGDPHWPDGAGAGNTLRIEIRKLGVNDKARTAAIRQLVLEAPAPVVAQALGYHHKTATELAAASGTPWSRYAPGDHVQ